MKNIYELCEKATPGPLVPIHGKGTCFHDGNLDSVQIFTKCGEETFAETVAEIWPSSDPQQSKADAALLAHCRNRFMEALEALRQEFEHRCRDNDDQTRIDALDALLSKLENVEGD